MCGISGFNWKNEGKIAEMISVLSHRGPDADGLYVDERISLGHNRLSILDLSESANQPMVSNDGNLVIVYNGEIYNFKELKKQLSEYDFQTSGDTEVILAGYEKWGKGVMEKLNGMFAFAIWDKSRQELFIARDRAGIKPLYYYWNGSKFILASEMKAIIKHDINRKLNINAFNHYMRVLYTPEPETLIQGIYKLPPSHFAILKDSQLRLEKYGQEAVVPSKLSYTDAVMETRNKVMNAVERQLVSDVPLGLYLSGGIDSSVILSAMSKKHKDIKTFSVGFTLAHDQEPEKFNHDFNLARATAKHFGTDHNELLISSQDALNAFEGMIAHNDDLVSNPTSLPMYLLSKFAKEQVSVVLSGNGGDELFGGYDRYRMAVLASYYKKLPTGVRGLLNKHSKLSKLDYKSDVGLWGQFMFEKDHKLNRVISDDFMQGGKRVEEFFEPKYFFNQSEDIVTDIMKADRQSWLVDHSLNLSDRMSMAHGLEERVPFLDNEIVAFADGLPLSHKVDLRKTKKVLKDAFRSGLPEALFNQPKRGWFSPGAKWLRDPEFSKFAQEVLSPGYYSGTRDLFDWIEVRKILDDHLSKKEYNLTIIWAILSFQVWARKYEIQQ